MSSKRISIDEYLASRGYGGVERKCFARDTGVIVKAVPSAMVEKAKFDKEAGTIRFVMSAEVEDRDRDIVIQAGLNTGEFEKNPVAPWAHRSSEPPVGQWSDIQKLLTGRPKRTEGLLTLTKGEPQADRLAVHLEAGSIRACSIGFMPLEIERRDVPEDKRDSFYYPGYIIHAADLYECSPCTIPANPAALAKAAAEGDVMARQVIEQVLDTWDLKNGLIVPRKAYEVAHKESAGARTSVVVLGEKRFRVALADDGTPTIEAAAPTPAEQLAESLERDTPEAKGLIARLAKVFGIERQPKADVSEHAEELTPEQKAAAAMAADLPQIVAKHEIIEADAALAALDAEMGQHVPA